MIYYPVLIHDAIKYRMQEKPEPKSDGHTKSHELISYNGITPQPNPFYLINHLFFISSARISPISPNRQNPSRQPQLAIKRIPIRFPAQKPLQRLHLVLAAALLQHQVPVPAALLPVHGVLGEDGVEHVGAVDLAGEVAVVAGVVAAEEVAEGGLAVACWGMG